MSGQGLLALDDAPRETVGFVPTRAAGLARLDRFVARAGRHYAGNRNYDLGPDHRSNVSALSPWIRHRLITEEEVLCATLARHGPTAAEKFIQEVFWRGYFKGWLEQRPGVWTAYRSGLEDALGDLEGDDRMADGYRAATTGATGIDCFDHWARELVETGYLHNHARMWFASIWIFTLRLPWELGADFFLRHLLDGDPAANTLSWRWVAGLHTKGKAYQARASNIAKYTQERFRPAHGLAGLIEPLQEETVHERAPLAPPDPLPDDAFLLLVTEEDCTPEQMLPRKPAATLGLLAGDGRSPLAIGETAAAFARGALVDALMRNAGPSDTPRSATDWADPIIAAAQGAGVRSVLVAHPPVGPAAGRLESAKVEIEGEGLTLHVARRPYDGAVWPHATRGFFALKKKIPSILRQMGFAQ